MNKRLLSTASSLLLGVAGLWVCLLALLYTTAFQRPDPNPALDGDPCCGHPDTWGDVVVGSVYFAATLSAAIGLLAASTALGMHAATGKSPQLAHTRRARLVALYCFCCGLAVPASWVVAGSSAG